MQPPKSNSFLAMKSITTKPKCLVYSSIEFYREVCPNLTFFFRYISSWFPDVRHLW